MVDLAAVDTRQASRPAWQGADAGQWLLDVVLGLSGPAYSY